jgi:hypothetical protein
MRLSLLLGFLSYFILFKENNDKTHTYKIRVMLTSAPETLVKEAKEENYT